MTSLTEVVGMTILIVGRAMIQLMAVQEKIISLGKMAMTTLWGMKAMTSLMAAQVMTPLIVVQAMTRSPKEVELILLTVGMETIL